MEEDNLNINEEQNVSSNIKDEILDDKKVRFLNNDDNNDHDNQQKNTFKIGDKVEARFNEALHKWQPGIIIDIDSDDEKYLIEYHDGDSERYVSPKNIRLMEEKKEVNIFKIGDKVEAKYRGKGKWFSGKIIDKGRISGNYVIQYDDGDTEKDVLPENIRLIEGEKVEDKIFKIGDKVEVNYRGAGKWYSGTIIEISNTGKKFVVKHDDGEVEYNIPIKDIRFICPKNYYKVGDRVEGNYKTRGKWYPGLIIKVLDSGYDYTIDYDNGLYDLFILYTNIRSLNDNYKEEIYPDNIYKVNDRVEARYGKRTRWYPGIITRAHKNNKYSVQYDDGEYETLVSEEFIRFLLPKDFPITESNESEKNVETSYQENSVVFSARERSSVPAISNVGYNYSVERGPMVSITHVTPPPEDDSLSFDLSGNSVDASGNKIIKRYKKFTYKEIQDEIIENYFDNKTGFSSSLDIIGTYLRGQKLIYMESKSYCENKLNKLMMPAIFLSTAATLLSAIVKEWYWGAYLIAGVNGIIAFLLAVVNYLKLDAASEAHKITAHQYDKLQTKIEFLSGQTLLFDSSVEIIKKELEDVKKKIEEIKETNQFIVPKKIRTLYPIMFNTNVFLIIKKIDDITKKKINAIKDLKNEKNYLIEVLKAKRGAGKPDKIIKEIELRITECQKEKKRNENNIVVLKSAFSVIDEMFMKEMENAEKYKSMIFRRWFLCGFGIKENITDPRQLNRFIEDIMNPYRDKIEEVSDKKQNNDVEQLVDDLTQTKKFLKSKRNDEFKRRQKTIKDLKKANLLLKENIGITKEICNKMEVYDKLERGEYDKINYEKDEKAIKLKRPKTIVKLLGISNDEEHINLKIHSDEEKASISGSDNSDPFVDYEVCKKDYEV